MLTLVRTLPVDQASMIYACSFNSNIRWILVGLVPSSDLLSADVVLAVTACALLIRGRRHSSELRTILSCVPSCQATFDKRGPTPFAYLMSISGFLQLRRTMASDELSLLE